MTTSIPTQDTLNQIQQGGAIWSVGGQLDIAAGGVLSHLGVNDPVALSIAIAAVGGSNTATAVIQLLDANGIATNTQNTIEWYLSDSATGVGLTATTASGAVGSGTSGTDLIVRTAKKNTVSQTSAAGAYQISIVDTANTGFYICVLWKNTLTVSAQLVSGNY